MKRAIAILLTVLYLLPTVGYSIDIHWCGKKVSAVSFSSFKSPKCSMCSVPRRCCKTTHTVVKLKDNQHGSSQLKIVSGSVFAALLPAYSILFSNQKECCVNPQYYRPPPCHSGLPVYLANGVIRV